MDARTTYSNKDNDAKAQSTNARVQARLAQLTVVKLPPVNIYSAPNAQTTHAAPPSDERKSILKAPPQQPVLPPPPPPIHSRPLGPPRTPPRVPPQIPQVAPRVPPRTPPRVPPRPPAAPHILNNLAPPLSGNNVPAVAPPIRR